MRSLPPLVQGAVYKRQDLYQLTMAQGYWETGQGDTQACFHMYFRDYPFKGGYAIACGMAQLAQVSQQPVSYTHLDVYKRQRRGYLV